MKPHLDSTGINMRRVRPAIHALALCLCATAASAQPVQNIALRNSFDPLGAGARGLGMAGAFIAVADDGTAATFNAAGLSLLRRTEVALVGFTESLSASVSRPGSPLLETAISHRRPDFFGIAVPFDAGGHAMTIQLSYQRAVDLVGEGSAAVTERSALSEVHPALPPLEADFVERVATEQSGAFRTLSLSAGYELTSRLSLGASLNYWFGDWRVNGSNQVTLVGALPSERGGSVAGKVFELAFDQEQSMRAFSLSYGLLLKYPRLSVGGVARLPFSSNYDLSEREVTDLLIPDESGATHRTIKDFAVRSQLRWPRRLGVGVALRPVRRLTLAADYVRSQWSRAVITDVPGGALLTDPDPLDAAGNRIPTFSDLNFFDLEAASQTETRDTSEWRGGAEYLLVAKRLVVPLRAGLFRERSPITDLGSDRGRRIEGFTLGSGLNFKHVVLDVTYERRNAEGDVGLRVNAQGKPAGDFARERVTENRVVASLIYRFGDDDPLKRALRFLFVGPKDE